MQKQSYKAKTKQNRQKQYTNSKSIDKYNKTY